MERDTPSPPTITAVTPNEGLTGHATRVTINGTGLGSPIYAWFGTNLATNFVVVSDASLSRYDDFRTVMTGRSLRTPTRVKASPIA